MNKIELLKMREEENYNISKSMISISKDVLDKYAKNYGKDLNDINDKIYRDITIKLFIILEENNAVTKNTQVFLIEKGAELRSALEIELLSLINISYSLSKIIEVKLDNELLKQIKENGSNTEISLDEYITKTVNAGKTLSKPFFPNIEKQIDACIEKILENLKLDSNLLVKEKIKKSLVGYKDNYLKQLGHQNKMMFGNFANLLEKAGTYLKSYAESVDELKNFKNDNVDELGVSYERETLVNNLGLNVEKTENIKQNDLIPETDSLFNLAKVK